MIFHEILYELRKRAGLKQTEVANYFTENGIPLNSKVISSWERGAAKPNAEQFLLLCKLYQVRDVLSVFLGISNPHNILDGLKPLGIERVEEYANLLRQNSDFSTSAPARVYRHLIPLYDLPVSAGTGAFLDSDHYEMIEADEFVPPEATFAVRISGDSMFPKLKDGQIIYIRQQQTLEIGEIGIFMLNGDAYCKLLAKNCLISLNPKYSPIPITEYDEFRVYGKVLET
jgi:SOS-response transcriptional repressor LexA